MIADRLRILREKWHLSQNQMSIKIGISQSTYSRIEAGKLSISEDALTGLARAKVNTNWLLTGDGEMLLTDTPEPTREEGDLAGELEERIRRIKIDVSDIEDTVRRWIQKKR